MSHALEAVTFGKEDELIDISKFIEYKFNTEKLSIATVPDKNRVILRMEAESSFSGKPSNWASFALSNLTNDTVEKLLVVPHHRLLGSGTLFTDLGSKKLVRLLVSHSVNFSLVEDFEADIYSIRLEPLSTITFSLELYGNSPIVAELWDPDSFNNFRGLLSIFHGTTIGIITIVILFLLVITLMDSSLTSYSAIVLGISTFFTVIINFDFLASFILLSTSTLQFLRLISEILLNVSFSLFFYLYLRLLNFRKAHRYVLLLALALFTLLSISALFDFSIAVGINRILIILFALGFVSIAIFLTFKRYDRARLLLFPLIFYFIWIISMVLLFEGYLEHQWSSLALAFYLTAITILISLIVVQNAFAESLSEYSIFSNSESKVLAFAGTGDIYWEWRIKDKIVIIGDHSDGDNEQRKMGRELEFDKFCNLIHPKERLIFFTGMNSLVRVNKGLFDYTFRLLTAESNYQWHRIRVRPVIIDNKVSQCIGSLRFEANYKSQDAYLYSNTLFHSETRLLTYPFFMGRLSLLFKNKMSSKDRDFALISIYINLQYQNYSFSFFNHEDKIQRLKKRCSVRVGQCIFKILRANDFAVNHSGLRYMMVLNHNANPSVIANFIQDLHRAIEKIEYVYENTIVSLRPSIGIAKPSGSDTVFNLVNKADIALSQALTKLDYRVVSYVPLHFSKPNYFGNAFDNLAKLSSNEKFYFIENDIFDISSKRVVLRILISNFLDKDISDFENFFELPEMVVKNLLGAFNVKLIELASSYLEKHKKLKVIGLKLRILNNINFLDFSILLKLIKSGKIFPENIFIVISEQDIFENRSLIMQEISMLSNLKFKIIIDNFGSVLAPLKILENVNCSHVILDETIFQSAKNNYDTMNLFSKSASLFGTLDKVVIVKSLNDKDDAKFALDNKINFGIGSFFKK